MTGASAPGPDEAARVVKSNPDAPQLPVQARALADGKLLYMAVPLSGLSPPARSTIRWAAAGPASPIGSSSTS